jgi:GDSL-like Lipase/Acylhydrolase family
MKDEQQLEAAAVPDNKSRPPVVTLFLRGALVFSSIAISVLIGEVFVRVFFPQPLATPWSTDMDGISCGRPNTHGRHFVPHAFDVTISYNSQHFRGQKEYTLDPAPGVTRIVMLGDSSTFGWGANDDETYPAQLEQILQNRYPQHPVEVINTAHPGLGPGEESLFYSMWVNKFHPSIVILNLHVNDPQDEVKRQLFGLDSHSGVVPRHSTQLATMNSRVRRGRELINSFAAIRFLTAHSELFNLVRRTASASLAKDEGGSRVDVTREQYVTLGIPLVRGEIGWLQERVRESNAKLVVVLIPGREAIYPFPTSWASFVSERQWEVERLDAALREVCQQRVIPFIDLGPSVLSAASRTQQPLYYFHGFETHPNPLGYRAFAEGVAAGLVEDGVISGQDGVGGVVGAH